MHIYWCNGHRLQFCLPLFKQNMTELERCGEECWRQSGECEQLPASCSWIDCASYDATTKGGWGRIHGGLQESLRKWINNRNLLSSPDTKPKDGKRKRGGSRFSGGDSFSPVLSNSSLQNAMDAGSLLKFCAAQENFTKFHRGLLNTKPLTEEVPESHIAGDSRVFVREPAYVIFSWIYCCVWYWVLLGGWAGSPQHVGSGTEEA